LLILALKVIMKREILPEKAKLAARVAPLLLALTCAVVACGDEAETVQQPEMEQQESQPESERPPPREGPEGCYIGAQMRCNCDLVEEDCTEEVGVWTMGCASCAAP
jgi:hypothetical protein